MKADHRKTRAKALRKAQKERAEFNRARRFGCSSSTPTVNQKPSSSEVRPLMTEEDKEAGRRLALSKLMNSLW